MAYSSEERDDLAKRVLVALVSARSMDIDVEESIRWTRMASEVALDTAVQFLVIRDRLEGIT